jgi:hypothetical protein
MTSPLARFAGTEWTGSGELWLDPLGDQAHRYDCTLSIKAGSLSYTWSHEGKAHRGDLALRDDGTATWSDTWHQPKPAGCRPIPDAWGILALHYTYPGSATEEWDWRIGLYQRPVGELVLQMTNIASWGEEARAVRMVFKPNN